MSTTENPSSAPAPHRTAEAKLTPERWQRVKEIFADAQERNPAERSSFLEQVCTADESLRSEVESLLAAAESEAAGDASVATSAESSHLNDAMMCRVCRLTSIATTTNFLWLSPRKLVTNSSPQIGHFCFCGCENGKAIGS